MKLRYLFALLLMLLPHPPVRQRRARTARVPKRQLWRDFASPLKGLRRRDYPLSCGRRTCGPCIVELPEWGRFAASRPDANLNIVHAEPMPRNPRLVAQILANSGLARARNWAFGEDSHERLRFEVDPERQGELPMTILVNPDVGTAHTVIGTADFAELRRWLDGWSGAGVGRRTTAHASQTDDLLPRLAKYLTLRMWKLWIRV